MSQIFAGGRNIAIKTPPHQYEATVQFYRDVIGLTPLTSYLPKHVFEFGASQLWIDRMGDYQVGIESAGNPRRISDGRILH